MELWEEGKLKNNLNKIYKEVKVAFANAREPRRAKKEGYMRKGISFYQRKAAQWPVLAFLGLVC